jgi:hypothetical protein
MWLRTGLSGLEPATFMSMRLERSVRLRPGQIGPLVGMVNLPQD